jgi:hypothetical protein
MPRALVSYVRMVERLNYGVGRLSCSGSSR